MSVTVLHAHRRAGDDDPDVNSFELILEGPPKGKDRPRLGKGGRVYTPKATKLAESLIIDAWVNAGSPRLEGAVNLRVALVVARGQDQYRTNGMLNAKGLRHPWPRKKPDVDNALKLVMDALNRRAYRDDVDVVEASVVRYWSSDGWERTIIQARELPR